MNINTVVNELLEDNRITICFENGFERNSDTKDIFEGIYGGEDNEAISDALEGIGEFSHTFFLKNPIKSGFEAFSDAYLVKRLIEDSYWTKIIMNDRPLIDGCYQTIVNKE